MVYQICYTTYMPQPFMAKADHPEKYNWRLNELNSLGISTLQKNGLNNHKLIPKMTNPEIDSDMGSFSTIFVVFAWQQL
jgi:hypothetical protein